MPPNYQECLQLCSAPTSCHISYEVFAQGGGLSRCPGGSAVESKVNHPQWNSHNAASGPETSEARLPEEPKLDEPE
ncbi:hypothetical protein KOW79_015478 [Hemibagrus wyckioides]|uniref:Uncharacterized protein n=1 Tax=Hemibagrus wyckioides TaxID=337641 RepID=A0A9D3SIV2_9TELE|nr:hypothetical protein KOW79_015478 [Hemibagrus wyckioides]